MPLLIEWLTAHTGQRIECRTVTGDSFVGEIAAVDDTAGAFELAEDRGFRRWVTVQGAAWIAPRQNDRRTR